MRSMWLFDGIFWGLLLVVIGVWIMIRRYVPVNIPLVRIILALIFVYLGVRILIRGPEIRERNTIVFSDSRTELNADTKGNDYNIIFSRGNVDLSGLSAAGGSVYKEVNVIFGTGTLRINPAVPMQIDMTGVFGTVYSPNGASVSFRDTVYSTPSYRPGADSVRIKATAVFGTLYIEEVAKVAPETMTPEAPSPGKK
jgi:hypothetical protein